VKAVAEEPEDRRDDGEGADERASYGEAVGFGVLSFGMLAVFGVVSSVVIARLYGVTVAGEYALAFAPVGILWGLSTLKEQVAMVRLVAVLPPRDPRVTGLFVAVGTFSFALTTVICALVALGTVLLLRGPVDEPQVVGPALVMIAGYLLFSNTAWNLQAILGSFRAGRQLFHVRLAQVATYLGLAVAGAFVDDSIWALVVATVGAAFVEAVLSALYALRWMTLRVAPGVVRQGFRELPDIVRFGAKTAVGGMAAAVSNETGTWLLALTNAPLAAVGAWSRAWLLGRRFLEANYKVMEALYPTLVERRANGDKEGFEGALVDTIRYCVLVLLLVAAAGGGASVAVMEVFGPGFEEGATALALLLLVPAIYSVASFANIALVSSERPLIGSVISLGQLAVTVGVGIPLVSSYDVTGAALACLSGYAVNAAVASVVLGRQLSQPWLALWPPRPLVATLVAYAAGFAAGRGVDSLIDGPIAALPALSAATAAFVGAYLLIAGLSDRERERLGALRRGVAARAPGRLRRPVAAGVGE
jgi:O-antigen/teichoic acid export membrane protein